MQSTYNSRPRPSFPSHHQVEGNRICYNSIHVVLPSLRGEAAVVGATEDYETGFVTSGTVRSPGSKMATGEKLRSCCEVQSHRDFKLQAWDLKFASSDFAVPCQRLHSDLPFELSRFPLAHLSLPVSIWQNHTNHIFQRRLPSPPLQSQNSTF